MIDRRRRRLERETILSERCEPFVYVAQVARRLAQLLRETPSGFDDQSFCLLRGQWPEMRNGVLADEILNRAEGVAPILIPPPAEQKKAKGIAGPPPIADGLDQLLDPLRLLPRIVDHEKKALLAGRMIQPAGAGEKSRTPARRAQAQRCLGREPRLA